MMHLKNQSFNLTQNKVNLMTKKKKHKLYLLAFFSTSIKNKKLVKCQLCDIVKR